MSITNQLQNRRFFMGYFAGTGLSTTLFPGVLWGKIQEEKPPQRITKEVIQQAEKIAGLEFTDQEREMMVRELNDRLQSYEKLRAVPLDNSVSPALHFVPFTGRNITSSHPRSSRQSRDRQGAVAGRLLTRPALKFPANKEEIAFWPVAHLSQLIRGKKMTSVELTKMYLNRLRKHNEKLLCVVTLTEELALEQARRADAEIAAGRYRGPLHGIPWGAKDLLHVKGYRTTWGAKPYVDQVSEQNATVVQRLEEAGAVLLAKLTLGELAMGDVWFGGKTRSPWNPEEGSSGSSAGPGSATAAGLVGFSIGSETRGSIVSPSTRCGVTGLRPTFGRVSRHGAMALAWSMDKIGPMCRTVEDCALVFDAIHGPDGKDTTVVDLPFSWGPDRDVRKLRIGYLKSAFERDREDKAWKANDEATLQSLRSLGVDLIPIELPDYPVEALSFILTAEAAAAFDDLTRSNQDDLLVRQERNSWPNTFRAARFIPAVEYIRANRVRTLVMQAMEKLMSEIDVYVAPSYGGNSLALTNLTGHPAVVLPNGFTSKGMPTSITFTGRLYGESNLLAVAKAYQDATDFHLKRPSGFL